jgi:hypothetical protein
MLELDFQKSYNYKSRSKASLSLPEIYILKTYGGLWSPVLIDELNIFPLRIKYFPINALSIRSLLVHMSWILACEKYRFVLILYFQKFCHDGECADFQRSSRYSPDVDFAVSCVRKGKDSGESLASEFQLCITNVISLC